MALFHFLLEAIGLVLLAATVYGQYECPPPWLGFHDKCYKYKILKASYADAVMDCARDSSTLISINSAEEHQFLIDWLRNNDFGNQEWFTSGRLRDPSETDPKFFWEGDGTEIQSFQFWVRPEDRFAEGDIIVYHTDSGTSWGWKLQTQNVLLPYVCEISKEDIHRIIERDRSFSYGRNEMDPAKIERGPHFTQEPSDFIYDADSVMSYVELECAASGLPHPTYKWFKERGQQSVEIRPIAETRYTITNGKLVINHPQDTIDNGEYQCSASNKFGTILSNRVQLSFGYLLDFPKSPRDDVVVDEHSFVGIECNPPKHFPAILYSWYKDSINNFVRPRIKPYIFISHNGKLYFSSVTEDDEGFYYCLVYSPRAGVTADQGKVSLPVRLRVRKNIGSTKEPEIANGFPTMFPSSPKRGDNVRLECFAVGTYIENVLQYQWSRVDAPMPEGATLEDHNRVLNIPNIQMASSGTYRCTVSRVNGQSSTGTIQVPVDAVPFFTISLKDAHVDRDSALRWMCVADGRPAVTYSWYVNGTLFRSKDPDRVSTSNNVLVFRRVLEEDAGMYQCAASNLHGTRYSSAQLRVLSFAPTFSKYPMQPTTYGTLGGNVTIICQPESAPTPTRVWKKNGRPMSLSSDPGARMQLLPNGNLFITRVGASDKARYTCVATNDHGEAEGFSRLLILSKTTISHFPSTTTAEVNQTAFLPCQASYNPLLDLTYMWFHNGQQIHFTRLKTIGNRVIIEHDAYYARGTGINRGGLRIERVQFEQAGLYTCIARTASDRIARSATLLVIGPPGMPASIWGTDVNATAIRIRWVAGPKNGKTIHSYRVEGYNFHEKFWRTLKGGITGRDLQQRSTVITGLSPWSMYMFRISAENILGMGRPSWPSERYTTAELPPEKPPGNVGGGGGKVGELVIEWDPLPPAEQNGENLYYIVKWKKSFIIDEEWTEQIVRGPNSDRYVVLVGQKNYYTKYDVTVQAANNQGKGPESPMVEVYSAEDIPIGVATNVRSFSYNSTALRVTWNIVANNRETVKGVLLGYRINYWKEIGEDESMSIYNVIPGQTNTGLVIGLEPHTFYYVNVQVFNSAGNGPKSQDYLEETLRSAPMNQPTEVHVKVVDHDSVAVDWRGVSTGIEEEPLQGYMVRIWRLGESIYFPTDYDANKKTYYTIDNLDSNVYYNLRVFGYSRGGQGLMSSPTVQFVLGKSCNIIQAAPDRRFIYACDGCISHISYLLLTLCFLVHFFRNQ